MAELNVLIVDDEPPARHRLRTLLADEADMSVAGECGDGVTAVRLIEELQPDLVLLDVQLPELDGLGVIERVGAAHMPPVIFVTAYDDYAVQAFDVAAVDYLMKPFDQERFRQALQRAREQRNRPGAVAAELSALLTAAQERAAIDRIPVRVGNRIRLVPVETIDYITAAGNYVRVHAGRETFLIRETISRVEDRLDAHRFARLHRSFIVNTQRVRELEPLYRGEYVVWLHDGVRLVTGRTYRTRVQQIFGV